MIQDSLAPGSTTYATRRTYLVLVILILGGAWLRWHDLGRESIWLDEALSLQVARLPWRQVIEAVKTDVHPPLYFLFLHEWMRVFGSSEVAVRSLSVVQGILALPLMFVCARALLDDADFALLATLLLSVSYFHIRLSQETRGYAQLVLLTLLSMVCYVRLRERPHPLGYVGYAVVTVLLIYTHYFGLFVPLVQNLDRLLPGKRHRVPWLPWLVTQGVLVLAYLPWVAPLLQQTSTLERVTHAEGLSTQTIAALFTLFSGNLFAALLLFVPLAILGVWLWLRRARPRPVEAQPAAAGLLFAWMIVPVLVPLAATPVASTFTNRNAIVVLPAYLLLVAGGMTALRIRTLQLAACVLVLGLAFVALRTYYDTAENEQWREVAAFVEQHRQAGDLVMFDNGPTQLAFDYYAHVSPTQLPRATFPNFAGDLNAALRGLVHDRPRVWLIVSNYGIARFQWRRAALQQFYRVANRQIRYAGVGIWLFEEPLSTEQKPAAWAPAGRPGYPPG